MDVIRKDVRSLVVPEFVFEEILPDFLRPEYHGTTFLIFKPNEQLLELADAGKELEKVKGENPVSQKMFRAI